jgi:iron(III) transport system substrate-binding protein
MRSNLWPWSLCFLSLATLAACARSERSAAPPADPAPVTAPAPEASEPRTLVVYSGRAEPLVAPVLAAFEKASGVDLQVKYGDTAQLAAALLEEGARSPADVFLAQDASTLGFLEGKGTFAQLSEAVTGRAASGMKSARGRWIGLSGRARVLAYNSKKLKPEELPANLDELTGRRWKGRVGWAPENASFQSFVAAMINLRGRDATEKWLVAMKANAPKEYPKNTPAVIAVSRGEVDVALVNHYYLHRLKAEQGADFPVANHYFRSGDAASLVNLSGGAVLAVSKKPALAEQLLTFLLGPEGQKGFVEGNMEFPIPSDVPSPIGLPAIATLNAPAIDPADLDNLADAVALLRSTEVLR